MTSPALEGKFGVEAELGVVIGRTMRRVTADKTLEHVLGYTVVNDVTARDFQKTDGMVRLPAEE